MKRAAASAASAAPRRRSSIANATTYRSACRRCSKRSKQRCVHEREGPPRDVYVSGAKPRREAPVRERGRRPKAQRYDSSKRGLTAANTEARSAKVLQ